MRIKNFTTWAVLILAGCTFANPLTTKNDQIKTFEMSDWKEFSITTSFSFHDHIVRKDGSISLTTFDTSTTERNESDFSVHIYKLSSASCSPSIVGASQLNPLSDQAEIKWGRVDYYDTEIYNPNPSPLCRLIDIFPVANSNYTDRRATYGLCSKYNGITAVVCINQMTDNSELAQQIFESFRWTN